MGKRIVYTIDILLFIAGCGQKEDIKRINLKESQVEPLVSKEEKYP
jgi:uncharacterized lipoprotein YehR (DUF1307 family)